MLAFYFFLNTMFAGAAIQESTENASQGVTWEQRFGEWHVTFHNARGELTCKHIATGATVSGACSFHVVKNEGKEEIWSIAVPRDSVSERLALLDLDGNVQGYLAVFDAGDGLYIQVIHRAAQNFHGELRLDAAAQLGERSFACRTTPLPGARVVQMASGHADSRLSDSLFDMDSDTALRFHGASAALVSNLHEDSGLAFRVKLTAIADDPAHSAISFVILRDYYRSRYVPNYRPIDKSRCPSAPTGWMSWNVYFDTAGEKENLDEARIAARYLKPYGMEIFSIESWQDNSPKLPVSQFHNLTLRPDPKKFPSGMKWLAEQIRALGFKAGIWTVPFGTGLEFLHY